LTVNVLYISLLYYDSVNVIRKCTAPLYDDFLFKFVIMGKETTIGLL